MSNIQIVMAVLELWRMWGKRSSSNYQHIHHDICQNRPLYIDIDMYVYIYIYTHHYCHHPHIFICIFVITVSLSSRYTFILYPFEPWLSHGSRSPPPQIAGTFRPGLEAAQELDFRCPQYGFSQSFCAVQGWHGKIRVKCWDFMVIWRFNGIERGLGLGSWLT
jgi:hypothetical protein